MYVVEWHCQILRLYSFIDRYMSIAYSWNCTDRRKLKACPSATLSTTVPTWTDLGLYMGIPGESLVTNCLSSGVTNCLDIFCVKCFYYTVVFCLAF